MQKSLYFISLFTWFSLCSLGVGIHSAPAWAEEDAATILQHERETFAKDFAQIVLSVLQDQKKSYSDRKDTLRQAFSNSVDIDWIAKFVLGKSWNNATDEQKAHYTELYRKYLTESYVTNFAENPDKRISDIKIFGVADAEESRFTVRTQMILADQEHLKVAYLVGEKDGGYKVLDIAIESVSLITTHRSEFTTLAAAQGVEGVISKLEQLTSPSSEITISMNSALH